MEKTVRFFDDDFFVVLNVKIAFLGKFSRMVGWRTNPGKSQWFPGPVLATV